MQKYHDLIESNITLIIFAYGLTYFSAGLAIALQPLQLSKFRLARYLWMLAAFGIIHGIAEWGDIFIPIQSPYLSEFWIFRLQDFQFIAWAVSYIFLLQFGATITGYHLSLNQSVRSTILRLLPFWGMAVTIIGVFVVPHPYEESFIRYTLGFPAAVLTAVAFLAERRTFTAYKASSRIYISLIAIAFGFYAVLGGLTVPEHGMPGLGWLHYENVFSYSLMPIYFWRMLIGLCITILIIRTLHMFDLEYRERLEVAEGERALAVERQRIARDLHDGVVQAIYATGLQLQVAENNVTTRPERTTLLIQGVLGQLNDVITNIRRYIYNLAVAGEDEAGFEKYINKIIDDFSAASSIPVSLRIEGKRVELTPKQKQNIAFITQECLSNVLKHSGASQAEIRFDFTPEALVFSVRDDGSGFLGDRQQPATDKSGRGIRGMRERAQAIDADMVISGNASDGGTLVSVTIPYKKARGFS
ncbi:MAG: sensor histidine kinase [Actinobacteria bacterium]|nr:sensor histidine kinase [Actinomycetota bacterium]